jgi:hypothetical protein
MSRGPGSIETRVGDLFAANRDRALAIDEVARHAFSLGDQTPSRAQRLSATRAAHRVIRRTREIMDEVRGPLWREESEDVPRAQQLFEAVKRIGFWNRFRYEGGQYFLIGTDYWRATTIGKGRGARLWFHAPNVPVQVWAVTIDRGGVHWFDAEVIRVTERNVMVRYGGEIARLDRRALWLWWAFWRGVMFTSSRTGRIAEKLDEIWWERYGATGSVPPVMQMPLADAAALLGVPANYSKDDVIAAFRRAVKKAHPDLGGTADDFRKLVEARDRLLAALGTSAPPPKMPTYYASGTRIAYRRSRSSQRRLGQTRRLAHG